MCAVKALCEKASKLAEWCKNRDGRTASSVSHGDASFEYGGTGDALPNSIG